MYTYRIWHNIYMSYIYVIYIYICHIYMSYIYMYTVYIHMHIHVYAYKQHYFRPRWSSMTILGRTTRAKGNLGKGRAAVCVLLQKISVFCLTRAGPKKRWYRMINLYTILIYNMTESQTYDYFPYGEIYQFIHCNFEPRITAWRISSDFSWP